MATCGLLAFMLNTTSKKLLVLAHVEELERALHHAERRVAETVQDAVGERAVVGADAERAAERLEPAHERPEAFLHPLDLHAVLGVGVLALLEAFLVGIVARIDANLLDVLGRLERCVRREVDVRHERRAHAAAVELGADRGEILGVGDRRCGDAHDLAAGRDESLGLGDGRRRVARVRRRHRLDAERIRAPDADAADPHLAGGTPPPRERAGGEARLHAGAPATSA